MSARREITNLSIVLPPILVLARRSAKHQRPWESNVWTLAGGRQVLLKLESAQPIGAFKIRGVTNALAHLDPASRRRGVICASTGNHGRALAYAARRFDSRATVCLSRLVPENKLAFLQRLGA